MLFGGVTYNSVERLQVEHDHGQYFWWGPIRLDTHHFAHNPDGSVLCKAQEGDLSIGQIRDPGILTKALISTAFPAFLIGVPIVKALGLLGINEVVTFMVVMPPLIAGWYYGIAWLDHRWRSKRLGQAC